MDVRRALYARAGSGMVPGLDATRGALARLGDPHLSLPCVHVAGTNGKGSVAAMIESIARAAGLRTGLYCSPHLCRMTEVMRLDGEPAADPVFEESLRAVIQYGPGGLTVFETLTVAAFQAFREAAVDLAILEVGLGGRRDATNVIEHPLATALTSVGLDHTAQLGPTLRDIAREKAGIFKPDAPIVVGPLSADVLSVVEDAAGTAAAGPITRVERGEAPAAGLVRVSMQGERVALTPPPPGSPLLVTPGLRGSHQADNAGVAAAVAWILAERWPAIHGAIPGGIAGVRWPGRLERLSVERRHLLLDCAHNPHAAAALVEALPGEGCSPERTVLVFGALGDKAFPEMLQQLAPCARRRIYTVPAGRRGAPLEELAGLAAGDAVADPKQALARALNIARPDETILVTGSCYLVGELRAAAMGIGCDPPFIVDLPPRPAA